MPSIVRVRAIRDMVLAILVVTARPAMLRPLLIACIVIDTADILSASLSERAGLFGPADTLALMTTAILALATETLAFVSLACWQSPGRRRTRSTREGRVASPSGPAPVGA